MTYTCPQCGPDPRGGEAHAADRHTVHGDIEVTGRVTGRTYRLPGMQNFPGTPAHALEVEEAGQYPFNRITDRSIAIPLSGEQLALLISLRPQVCAHCGGRDVRSDDRDHLCCAAIMDWIDGLRGTEREPYTLNELMDVLEELGVN